jgi:peptidoglycan/LPS O-acetylase OafA/YrhL
MYQRELRGPADAATRQGKEESVTSPVVPPLGKAPSGQVIPARREVHSRLAALDGLRFLAALAVVLFHFVGQTHWGMIDVWGRPWQVMFPEAHSYFAYGRLGVDLFFMISGYVICMSAWGRSPRDFFISRVTRLFPMYWIAIAVAAAVIYLFDTPFGHPNPRVLFANLTMLQTPLKVDNLDSVYWTLWPELCFYLTFSVVVWMGLTYTRVAVFCGIWTVAAVLAPSAGIPLLTLLVNPTSAPFFIAGLAFHLMHRFRSTPLLWGIVLMQWLLVLHFMLAPHGGRNNWDTWAPWRGWLVLVVTVFFVLIASIALGWTRHIRWKGLTALGATTFPLYLLHDPVGMTIARHYGDRVNAWVLIGVTVTALIVLSYLVHRFVERPMAKAMRRWLNSASFGLQSPRERL